MLDDLPDDMLGYVMQFLNLAEVDVLLGRINHNLREKVMALETRACSTMHKYPHHILLCKCQLHFGFRAFCSSLQSIPNSVQERAIIMQVAWRDLGLPQNWEHLIIQSYVQTGTPYRIMMCVEPHLLAIITSQSKNELRLLLSAYLLYGIRGETPDWSIIQAKPSICF